MPDLFELRPTTLRQERSSVVRTRRMATKDQKEDAGGANGILSID